MSGAPNREEGWKYYMEKIDINEVQKQQLKKFELDILMEIDRICKKNNIKYTLGYGTLIGAVRHKGFIPWDDDIDICMLRKDYMKFRKICETELDHKFFYQTHSTDKEYYHLFDKVRMNNTVFKETFLSTYNIHHGVYVDIFPIDNIANGWLNGIWQYYQYRLYRTILNSKYLVLDARTGKKKIVALVIKILFAKVKLEYLYDKAEKKAMKYVEYNTNFVGCFASAYKRRDRFPTYYYKNTIPKMFEGMMFEVPFFYDEMLKRIYGDYMQIPAKEKQITRHDLVEIKL